MKFWTNRISTGNSESFSSLIEKIAASRQQVKTASAPAVAEPESKVAEKVEPANEDNKKRTGVHGVEGSPSDGNGEPEGDDEKKTVSAQVAPVAARPLAAKPAVNPAVKPLAAKPAMNPAVKPLAAKPAVAPVSAAPKPAANPVAQKPSVNPAAPKPMAKMPALAASTEEVVVAETEGDSKAEVKPEGGKFPEPDREQMYKQEPQEEGGATTEKEASHSPEFVKIANLKPKAKAFLKRYWGMLYPGSYADAMTQDK